MMLYWWLTWLPLRLLFAVNAALWLSTTAALCWWLYRDASARGSRTPTGWALSGAFVPLVLPYYLYKRRRGPVLSQRERSVDRLDRRLGTVVTAGLGAFLVGLIVTPPDPVLQFVVFPLLFLTLLPVAYVLVYRGGYRRLAARLP